MTVTCSTQKTIFKMWLDIILILCTLPHSSAGWADQAQGAGEKGHKIPLSRMVFAWKCKCGPFTAGGPALQVYFKRRGARLDKLSEYAYSDDLCYYGELSVF